MQPKIEAALSQMSLEARLRALIQVKFEYFAPNRSVLRALLRNGADPAIRSRRSARKQRKSAISISSGFAAFWPTGMCGFRAISDLIYPACSGSFRWA